MSLKSLLSQPHPSLYASGASSDSVETPSAPANAAIDVALSPAEHRGDVNVFDELNKDKQFELELCQFIKVVGNNSSKFYDHVINVKIDEIKVSCVCYSMRRGGFHMICYILLMSCVSSNVHRYPRKRTKNTLLTKD